MCRSVASKWALTTIQGGGGEGNSSILQIKKKQNKTQREERVSSHFLEEAKQGQELRWVYTLSPFCCYTACLPSLVWHWHHSPSLAPIDCSWPLLPQLLSLLLVSSPTCIYARLPGNKRPLTTRRATGRWLVKFVTRVSLNKIKLKVLLRCQDKVQAAEVISHPQTLNYPVRLDQIQSKGGKLKKKKEKNWGRTSRNRCKSLLSFFLGRFVKEVVAMVIRLGHMRHLHGCGFWQQRLCFCSVCMAITLGQMVSISTRFVLHYFPGFPQSTLVQLIQIPAKIAWPFSHTELKPSLH